MATVKSVAELAIGLPPLPIVILLVAAELDESITCTSSPTLGDDGKVTVKTPPAVLTK